MVGLLGALLAIVSGGGDGRAPEDEAGVTSTTLSRNDLEPAATELLDLLERGRSLDYHARYRGVSPDVDGEILLETWQSPPRIRQDSELNAGGNAIRTRTIGDGVNVVRCGQIDGAWTCQPSAASTDPLGPVSNATIDQITRGSVGVRDTTVDGRAARCFTLRVDQGNSELCTTTDGIVLKVASAGSEIELVELDLDPELDEGVFTPPTEAVA